MALENLIRRIIGKGRNEFITAEQDWERIRGAG